MLVFILALFQVGVLTPFLLIYSATMPLLLITYLYQQRGRIGFHEFRAKKKPSIAYPLISSSLGLFIHFLISYSYLNVSNLWLPAGAILLVLFLLLLGSPNALSVLRKKFHFDIVLITLFLMPYAVGLALAANYYLDADKNQIYRTVVTDREVYKGRKNRLSYSFKLDEWGRLITFAVMWSIRNCIIQNQRAAGYMYNTAPVPWA